MDVFISYSSKDKDWVRGVLLPRIEDAGLRAFIDYRDFTRGAPSIKECERGVVECPKTLLVLTPNYVASGWTEIENVMAQTLDPANASLRLIPLLKVDCKKPLRIGALTHIDFTDEADEDLAWRQLLTSLGRPQEPEAAPELLRDDWFLAHPYPLPPHFTGRVDERAILSEWLNDDPERPLLSLRALGGFGKSALAWYWLTHDVDAADWPRVVWWSFYESDARFEDFVATALRHLGRGVIDPQQVTQYEVETLFQSLYRPGALLVLDGFERELRAFGGLDAAYQGDEGRYDVHERDCISPLAETFLRNVALQPQLRSKVLLTTRLTPRVLEVKGIGLLEGCRQESLNRLKPDDAFALFKAMGVRGTRAEIEAACSAYGYHPLSLCLLAGLIVGDLEQPGDVAAAQRLDVSGSLAQRQHHVLEAAYDRLEPSRQALLGRLACFRSPMDYPTLRAMAEGVDTATTLDADLRDLVRRGFVHHDTREGRFDLHPIVRHYAYDWLTDTDRADAHAQLRDYFAAVPEPEHVTCVEDLAPVVELYHHTIRSGQFDEALTLFRERLSDPLYYQFGAYQLRVDLLRALFPNGEDHPPRLEREDAQAWTLNALAISYSFSGQPRRAVPLFEQAIEIDERWGDETNLVIDLGNVAHMARLPIGDLRAAEADIRRSIELCRKIEDQWNEAAVKQEWGRLLAYRGSYAESEAELTMTLKTFEERGNVQAQGYVWASHAERELLQLRTASRSAGGDPHASISAADRALELASERERTDRPNERDYVRAHWLLGAAHRVAGETDESERHLHEALMRCRRINLVEAEADILIDLARLRATTDPKEAHRLAEEALGITGRCGYVLQGADAHLELAKLALADGGRELAREHAEKAHELATCDGPPDHTYKAAYDEAEALLGELGRHE